MTTRGHRLGSLLVGLLALAAWGCASSTKSTTSATPMDLPGLAGTWQGSNLPSTDQPLEPRSNSSTARQTPAVTQARNG